MFNFIIIVRFDHIIILKRRTSSVIGKVRLYPIHCDRSIANCIFYIRISQHWSHGTDETEMDTPAARKMVRHNSERAPARLITILILLITILIFFFFNFMSRTATLS